jgi:hypothetical protein
MKKNTLEFWNSIIQAGKEIIMEFIKHHFALEMVSFIGSFLLTVISLFLE